MKTDPKTVVKGLIEDLKMLRESQGGIDLFTAKTVRLSEILIGEGRKAKSQDELLWIVQASAQMQLLVDIQSVFLSRMAMRKGQVFYRGQGGTA
jgi:hypothetical protein